jgi:phosphohistidine phosphatase
MKTLLLLRHAKAERESLTGEDFDRPLAARGRLDAARLGVWLVESGFKPELIIESPSLRTTETVKLVAEQLHGRVKIEDDDTLYLGSAAKLLTCIHRLSDAIDIAMVVAHNPGMEELAQELARRGSRAALDRMLEKFPTSALAIFAVDVTHWSDVARKTSSLTDFYTPHDHNN